MLEKLEKFQLVLLAIILAFGAFFATKYATNSLSREGISVTGSSYEIVKSDSGKLSFDIKVKAVSKANAYNVMKTQLPEVEKYLTSKGIKPENIEIKNEANASFFNYYFLFVFLVPLPALQFYFLKF